MKKIGIVVLLALSASLSAQTRYNVTYTAPLPGGEYAIATGVNDAGVMVGYSRYWPVGQNPHERGFLSNGSRTRMLDNLSPSYPVSEAFDVNNNTDVVGYAYDQQGNEQALMWIRGRIQVPLTPSGMRSVAFDINNRGQVVGHTFTAPFLYDAGVLTLLPKLAGPNYHRAVEISENGLIVGASAYRAVYWTSAGIHVIPFPGGPTTWYAASASACNDQGTIVGAATYDSSLEDPNAWRGFIYSGGRVKLLPYPTGTHPADINNQGTMVGMYVTVPSGPLSPRRAFVYENGVRYDLQDLVNNLPPGWRVHWVHAISETGIIAGHVANSDSSTGYAAIFTPAP